jgi:hypothetical protein
VVVVERPDVLASGVVEVEAVVNDDVVVVGSAEEVVEGSTELVVEGSTELVVEGSAEVEVVVRGNGVVVLVPRCIMHT